MASAPIDLLSTELPEGAVVTDPDIVASYRQDRAADPAAGTALAVVRPTCTEDVQTVLRWASAPTEASATTRNALATKRPSPPKRRTSKRARSNRATMG